jgi:hypothetical protein
LIFSVLFVLSILVMWAILYRVYNKARLKERQEAALRKRPTAPSHPVDADASDAAPRPPTGGDQP